MNLNDLQAKSIWLRQQLFEMAMRPKKGHIPSSFSCAEILIALYYGGVAHVSPGKPEDPNRDRIIVSKGHAAMSQYPILADLGFFPKSEFSKKFTISALIFLGISVALF